MAVKKLLQAPQRVLKYCIQTNITLADKMRVALIPEDALKGPLTASILDTFRRRFGDSVHPPHPPRSMLSREDAADPQASSG